MYSGVSGLRAEGEALGVVGDNIANINTVGFKSQRAVFQDVLGHSILAGTGSSLPGSGVRVGDIQQMFTQGSLSNTGISTDLALNGDGFFVVKGAVDGVTANFFSRAGQFEIDNQGYLVNPNGLQVQGYAANPDGTFQASISSIQAPTSAIQPHATENGEITANLDSSAAIPTNPFDIADPANTANFSSTMTVYDSLGNGHTMDVYFVKTADNTWDWHGVIDAGELGGTAGTNQEVGTGTLTFTTDGALDTVSANTATADFTGATAGQVITLDFGTAIGDGGTGFDGTTQFASSSNVSS